MIPTIRKEIDDQWIEVYLEMKHQTTVRIKTILQKYLKDIVNLPPEQLKIALSKAVSIEDNDQMDTITILGQVKAWSFGEVTLKVLDDEISESKRVKILYELNGLYSPLAESGSASLPVISTPIS